MSHHGLFKLMERHIPTNILSLLEQWFAVSVGAINFQCSLVCYAAFDKAEYCHHICLPALLTAWLIK